MYFANRARKRTHRTLGLLLAIVCCFRTGTAFRSRNTDSLMKEYDEGAHNGIEPAGDSDSDSAQVLLQTSGTAGPFGGSIKIGGGGGGVSLNAGGGEVNIGGAGGAASFGPSGFNVAAGNNAISGGPNGFNANIGGNTLSVGKNGVSGNFGGGGNAVSFGPNGFNANIGGNALSIGKGGISGNFGKNGFSLGKGGLKINGIDINAKLLLRKLRNAARRLLGKGARMLNSFLSRILPKLNLGSLNIKGLLQRLKGKLDFSKLKSIIKDLALKIPQNLQGGLRKIMRHAESFIKRLDLPKGLNEFANLVGGQIMDRVNLKLPGPKGPLTTDGM